MSLVSDTNKSVQEKNEFFVVLVLSKPPSPWKVEDWYWKPIAEVPFLLRNILSIQQAGAKQLILFAGKSVTMLDELCRRAESDPRIRMKLECHSEPEKWVSSLQKDSTVLFLDGSALQKKPPIEKTLRPTRKEQNPKTDRSIHLSPNDLKNVVAGNRRPWLFTLEGQRSIASRFWPGGN